MQHCDHRALLSLAQERDVSKARGTALPRVLRAELTAYVTWYHTTGRIRVWLASRRLNGSLARHHWRNASCSNRGRAIRSGMAKGAVALAPSRSLSTQSAGEAICRSPRCAKQPEASRTLETLVAMWMPLRWMVACDARYVCDRCCIGNGACKFLMAKSFTPGCPKVRWHHTRLLDGPRGSARLRPGGATGTGST